MRAALRDGLWSPASISDVKDPTTLAALLEFDSNYGRWSVPVSATADSITIGDQRTAYRDASGGSPDWGAMDVEMVVDCTGRFSRELANSHLERGAKRALWSGPAKTLDESALPC